MPVEMEAAVGVRSDARVAVALVEPRSSPAPIVRRPMHRIEIYSGLNGDLPGFRHVVSEHRPDGERNQTEKRHRAQFKHSQSVLHDVGTRVNIRMGQA